MRRIWKLILLQSFEISGTRSFVSTSISSCSTKLSIFLWTCRLIGPPFCTTQTRNDVQANNRTGFPKEGNRDSFCSRERRDSFVEWARNLENGNTVSLTLHRLYRERTWKLQIFGIFSSAITLTPRPCNGNFIRGKCGHHRHFSRYYNFYSPCHSE